MKSFKHFQVLFFLMTALFLSACAPQPEVSTQFGATIIFTDVDRYEMNEQLSKTDTGKRTIQDLNTYPALGYHLMITALPSAQLMASNGHDGGKIEVNVAKKTITIFVNNSLPANEQAHVIVHEASHIKDDFIVEKILAEHPDVHSMINYFIERYKTKPLTTFDPKPVKLVLTTLFCTEARAYSQNQKLAREGFSSEFFVLGDKAPQLIDQNYIKQFKTSYAAQAAQLHSWCLSKPSIKEVLKHLLW